MNRINKYLKKFLIVILLLNILFCFSLKLNAKTKVYASSYILMEANSKRILAGENINTRYLTASICKILTAIIVIENINIDDYVVVDEVTVNQLGSKIYLEIGDLVKVRDLLYGLMLQSGNDCAYLLARTVCGEVSQFSKLMNRYAQTIGMKHSYFTNPSGLDEESENYSTSYDMAILMIYAMQNPVFRNITQTKKYSFISGNEKKYFINNKHKLVTGYDFIIGGKTGYTVKAHRTLVTYASMNNMELVCVTFNCSDDWNTHYSLFNESYKKYKLTTVMKKQIIKTNINHSQTPYLEENIVLPLTKYDEINIKVFVVNKTSSNIVGKVIVYINQEEIVIKDLVSYY